MAAAAVGKFFTPNAGRPSWLAGLRPLVTPAYFHELTGGMDFRRLPMAGTVTAGPPTLTPDGFASVAVDAGTVRPGVALSRDGDRWLVTDIRWVSG